MTLGRYDYCAIYVQGVPDQHRATDLLATVIGGRRDTRTIHCDGLDIDVLANPDHDPTDSEFVRWPIKIEIHPDPTTPPNHTVSTTRRILTWLWNSGHNAVAACDYEPELPDDGGYPRHRP